MIAEPRVTDDSERRVIQRLGDECQLLVRAVDGGIDDLQLDVRLADQAPRIIENEYSQPNVRPHRLVSDIRHQKCGLDLKGVDPCDSCPSLRIWHGEQEPSASAAMDFRSLLLSLDEMLNENAERSGGE